MKRMLLLFAVLVCFAGKAKAQAEIPHLAADPPTCDNTRGLLYYNTTTGKVRSCTALNTWSDVGGGITPNNPLPLATSGPGPVFNVRNYGAKGDSQATDLTCSFTTGVAQFTCSGAAFSSATDVGKNIFCNSSNAGASFFGNSLQTIISVQNATTATASTTSLFTAAGACTWGTIDDTAISAAVTAAKAASKAVNAIGNKGIFTAAPTVYFPAGGYLVCTLLQNAMVSLGSTVDGFGILGDGTDVSFVYAGASNACPVSGSSVLGSFVQVASGANNVYIKNLTFDGVANTSGNGAGLGLSGAVKMYDVIVQRWGGNGQPAILLGGQVFLEHVLSFTNIGVGVQCNSCQGEWVSGGSSNNGNSANLVIGGVVGSNTSAGFRIGRGVLIDECGSNATGCTQVANSNDVWFIGSALFGTTSGFCLNVDANSFVHWSGGICGTFGTDNNANGPRVATGGVLQMSDVRSIGSGTGKCLTINGSLFDNGGNSCESMFPVVSSTSTGTTAVLTVTTLGANASTNCTVGDALVVEGNTVAGYNGYFSAGATSGITAVGATTITYTTIGTNIGAGGGGTAHCRNLQSFTGNLPKALLNNPIPNTCYVTITPIVNATTYQMCNFGAGSATNISRITATSQNVTTCATAPIITITNGTATETLTLTSGKQFWDSFNAQDASSGVGTTIFKPSISLTGTDRITMRYDAGALSACATPPTQLSVSYTIAPILSN